MSMQVTVRFYSILRDTIGRSEVYTLKTGSNVGLLLETLIQVHGDTAKNFLYTDDGRLKGSITILVNGANINHINHLETTLGDGDTVNLLPPVGGG